MTRVLIFQHLEREGPGLFMEVAHKRRLPVSIFRLDRGDCFPQVKNEDLLIILGGPMSVKDINSLNYPWMAKEIQIIKDALDKRIRIIGICLGAQLLASAAGGNVEPLLESSSKKIIPEVGWDPIFLKTNASNKLFDTVLASPLDVLHWHEDRILLPSSATLIGSSKRCKEQFFQIGEFSYGLQFHIEIDNNMVQSWVEEDSQFIKLTLGQNAKEKILKQQSIYCEKTINRRLLMIETLFDAIDI